VILSGPFWHRGHCCVRRLSAACFSLRLVMPLARAFPISFSLVLNSLLMSVKIFLVSSRTLVSCACRASGSGFICSNSCMRSSSFLVSCSSIIIGEYFSRASMRCMPNGVALMDLPSKYPRLKSVSMIADLVAFVPRFFFSSVVRRPVGV